MVLIYTSLSPTAVHHQVVGGCSGPCSCPLTPPSCPVGVSLVLDECGCCKVCAQQFNQDCGTDKPCDHIKGLRCHLGAGGDPERGLCRGEKTPHTNMLPTILFPLSYTQYQSRPSLRVLYKFLAPGPGLFRSKLHCQNKKFLKSLILRT